MVVGVMVVNEMRVRVRSEERGVVSMQQRLPIAVS